ncbi:Glutaredoxin, partial [Dysosmobacter welbionis]
RSFLHRRIFAVPQHLAELHGIRVALRGEQQHLAEPVQADGLPQVLVLVRLHQGRDQAHAHRAGLAGDHRGIALHRHAQHPHAPG